jgi:glutamyl-tRNA reductase
MSTKDLRKEINRVIQHVPDDFLNDILDYLKKIEMKSEKDIESFKHLKQIFKDDQELLEKLAK